MREITMAYVNYLMNDDVIVSIRVVHGSDISSCWFCVLGFTVRGLWFGIQGLGLGG